VQARLREEDEPQGQGRLRQEEGQEEEVTVEALRYEEPQLRWSDRRVERMLGALVALLLAFVGATLAMVLVRAWPSFAHNGLHWFGTGGNVDQQIHAIFLSGDVGGRYVYTFHAWPLIWSTILITGGAVVLAFVSSLFVAVFAVEFAPAWMKALLGPTIRLLASVPSVIYGLLGVLVLVPYLGNHVISEHEKASVAYAIQLSGPGLLAAVLVLTVMIAPLMVAIFADGLRAVPPGWLEGSLALGVNRWRTFWKIGVRTARPAFVAGTVLATARALGEAVMLAMISGGIGFAPNPADGLIFLFEPSRPLAATILANSEELSSPPMGSTLFAIAAVLLVSAALLSLVGWAAKQPMKRYGVRA
jgi:ABC-type phosphate transport system permease subunit